MLESFSCYASALTVVVVGVVVGVGVVVVPGVCVVVVGDVIYM